MSEKRGLFVVVTGPSGAGKTVMVDALLKRIPKSTRLITWTTRLKRPGEEDGVHYHFTATREFVARRDKGEFFEWARVYDCFYGNSRTELEQLLDHHDLVFAILDVQGACKVKALMPECLVGFVRARSEAELARRLWARKGATADDVDRRLKAAAEEMDFPLEVAGVFCVVNADGKLEEAIGRMERFLLSVLKGF